MINLLVQRCRANTRKYLHHLKCIDQATCFGRYAFSAFLHALIQIGCPVSNHSKIYQKSYNFISTILLIFSQAWRSYKFGFISIIFIDCIRGLLPVMTAWITKTILDLLVERFTKRALVLIDADLVFILVIQVSVTIISQITVPISEYLNAELGRRLVLDVQSLIYRKINSLLGIAPFEDPYFYDTIQLSTQSGASVPQRAVTVSVALLRNIITFVSFLSILFVFNPLLTGAVIITSVPQLYILLKRNQQRFNIVLKNSPKERMSSYYTQVLSGITFAKEVALFNLSGYFLNKWSTVNRELQSTQRQQERTEFYRQCILITAGSLVTAGTFLIVVNQAFMGHLTVGDMTLYIAAAATLQATSLGIMAGISAINENILFYERFKELLSLTPSIAIARDPQPFYPLKSAIEFRNVSFRYKEDQQWILNHLNLIIPANRSVALIGLNGAGKTTLVKLLARFYDPVEGSILWDGVDIREFDIHELRAKISFLFQDFARYDLTAQDNIGIGDIENINDLDKVHQAAIRAGAEKIVEKLPKQYNTFLSRRLAEKGDGVDLSGGEWQKIATARVLMRESYLLILDEPTASLDPEAEHELYRYFIELATRGTCLLISHRFSTVRIADIIAVLKNGEIQEYGTHLELLAQGGTYARLFNLQTEQNG